MSGAKRILAALVAAAVLLMGTAALAEDTKINISAGEAGADGTITVTVSLSGGTSVAGAQLALDYDETMLELVNVKNGAIVSGGISATNDEEPGSVIFIWSTLMGSKQPGELLKLTFRPKEGAHGSTEIKLDNALTETSISPVGCLAFLLARSRTVPVTEIVDSLLMPFIMFIISSVSMTICVVP